MANFKSSGGIEPLEFSYRMLKHDKEQAYKLGLGVGLACKLGRVHKRQLLRM